MLGTGEADGSESNKCGDGENDGNDNAASLDSPGLHADVDTTRVGGANEVVGARAGEHVSRSAVAGRDRVAAAGRYGANAGGLLAGAEAVSSRQDGTGSSGSGCGVRGCGACRR